MGLVAPWHVESSQIRDRTRVPCIGRQIPIHCAIREVPQVDFNIIQPIIIPSTLFLIFNFFKEEIIHSTYKGLKDFNFQTSTALFAQRLWLHHACNFIIEK